MARCDGNNCLYNAQRGGQKNLLAGLPCAGSFLASTGVTSWDKTEWAPAKPGAAWPAATWHGIQGEPWLCCAMGLPSACPASTAWTVAKHSRQDTMILGALRHNDQCHTAVTPLGQGTPGPARPGCGNGDKGQCSCTEPALLRPPQGTICQPGQGAGFDHTPQGVISPCSFGCLTCSTPNLQQPSPRPTGEMAKGCCCCTTAFSPPTLVAKETLFLHFSRVLLGFFFS